MDKAERDVFIFNIRNNWFSYRREYQPVDPGLSAQLVEKARHVGGEGEDRGHVQVPRLI
jgi:hypothetical protein